MLYVLLNQNYCDQPKKNFFVCNTANVIRFFATGKFPNQASDVSDIQFGQPYCQYTIYCGLLNF